jgi:PAS domain S-box-containing protein
MWAFDVETLEFLDVNDAALARYGYTRAEFLGLTLTDIHPHQDAPRVIECVAEDGRDEIMYRGTFRHLTRDGALVEAEVSTQEVVLGGRRARLALALDVTERNRAVARERYLAEASRVLGSSLDYESTLRHVAQFAVPSLADWCAIDLVADDGSLEQMAVVHTDPARVATARELRRRYPSPPDSPSGIHAVVRTGRSEFYPVVTDALLDTVAQDAAHLGLLRALQFSSIIIAPLLGQIGVRGAITLVFAESGRRYTEGDRALAEEIGRRAAFAIDNARLYAAEQQARQRAEAAATRTARLQAVTAALSATLTPAQVAQVVIEHGVAALGAQAAAVAELDESASTLVMLGAVGYPAEAVARFRHLPLDAHFPLAEAVRSGEPIILATDTERDARYPNLTELRRANGGGAMAAIPLAVEGRRVGVLGINFPEQLVLGDEDRRFVLALAQQCAQALDRARLYEAEQRAREEAQLQREQAEAANRAKGEFLAVMSHELRTPLNAIAGYVELLELGIRGPVTDAQREDLQRIRRSQRHLLALVNDVLNFVRLDAGQVRYEIDDVPLAALLADVGTLVGPQLAAKQLRFEVRDAPPGRGDRDRAFAVRADRDKVAQILLNLLSNAIKFTPVGGRITLSCDLAADAATVLLRVADDGIGIPADHLAVIFEPFVQVQRGLTRTTEGTGLGLAISRDLARAMGGELQVESTLGGGSVFTLLLPAAT